MRLCVFENVLNPHSYLLLKNGRDKELTGTFPMFQVLFLLDR